jgi:hypothetical protein
MVAPVAFVGGMPGGLELLVMLFMWVPFLLVPVLALYYLYRIDRRLGRLVELQER